uniref:separase n=1 Tax=Denticeps clupeoides TaxID=299321 RepID=A0AAY4C5R0_9TELE
TRMRCLKVEEYLRRLSDLEETDVLYGQLEKYVAEGLGPHGRTLCDRVVRACHQRLADVPPTPDHMSRLVSLVELAVQGYDRSGERPSRPLYLEKIALHILQRLEGLGRRGDCSRLGELLFRRLLSAEPGDYQGLLRNCFAVLWNRLGKVESPAGGAHQALRWRLEALRFCLMEATASPGMLPRVCVFFEETLTRFETECSTVTLEDATALLRDLEAVVLRPLWPHGGCAAPLVACCVKVCKLLSKAGLWDQAAQFAADGMKRVRELASHLLPVMELCKWAVRLHCALASGKLEADAEDCYKRCTEGLWKMHPAAGDSVILAAVEVCQLVMLAMEVALDSLDGERLQHSVAFLKQHHKYLQKQEVSLFPLFSACFPSPPTTLRVLSLDSVVQWATPRLILEMFFLPLSLYLLCSVFEIKSVVYELVCRQQYKAAMPLVDLLTSELKSGQTALPVEKVNRVFLLVVKCARKAGLMERALQLLIDWLYVLGDKVLEYCQEPVTLWVRTKAEAAKAGLEDLRLRTLREGFVLLGSEPCEDVVIRLLQAECLAYRQLPCDSAQERFNILCDLLSICHEDSAHKQNRAHILCEMAQVVCFQDFSQQIDCLPVDFTHEAISLLEMEPDVPENRDKLIDDLATASLWLFICNLESGLQEAILMEKRLKGIQKKQVDEFCDAPPTNDLDHEDRRSEQDSNLLYEGLCFNLSQHTKRIAPLQRALSLWESLLNDVKVPTVRDPKQTAYSLGLMAALYTLMGKPIQAVKSYRLAADLYICLGDAKSCASSMCYSGRLLLELGCLNQAQAILQQAEQCLTSDSGLDGVSLNKMMTKLLRAEVCYYTGQVEQGVCSVCEVLCETGRKCSKSWYLLRVQALQIAASFLSLDTHTLPPHLRQHLTQQGLMTPDSTLYEGLKVLCSLVVRLFGSGHYGAAPPSSEPNTRFADQGECVFKWQLLSEVCACAQQLVCVRSTTGSTNEAKVQCLEALKLSAKLQSFSICSELLVCKAELELLKGMTEVCVLDLQQVQHLLELPTEFPENEVYSQVHIKPRKAGPSRLPCVGLSPVGEDLTDDSNVLLGQRALHATLNHSEKCQGSSPPLKKQQKLSLSCLTHPVPCSCGVCSDVTLGRVAARWALAQACVTLSPSHAQLNYQACLRRCQSLLLTLQSCLSTPASPATLRSLQARALHCQAQSMLTQQPHMHPGLWDVLEQGLTVTEGQQLAELLGHKAGLMALKGMACCLFLATKSKVSPENLFSVAWAWNPPTASTRTAVKKSCSEETSLLNPGPDEDSHTLNPVPKIAVSAPLRSSVFKTPRLTSKPRPKAVPMATPTNLRVFDFSSEDQSVTATPQPKSSKRGGKSKAVAKGTFQVFEDQGPQQKTPAAPAAPRRPKLSRFKMNFSDDSDSEVAPPTEVEVKTCVLDKSHIPASVKRRTTARPRPNTALSDDELGLSSKPCPRRGRSKKDSASKGVGKVALMDEPEKLRMVREDDEQSADISFEQLLLSESETVSVQDGALDSPDAVCEILRRELGADRRRDLPSVTRKEPQIPVAQYSLQPDLSLDSALSLLRSSWLLLQHFPPPSLYSRLCSLMAQLLGHQDPDTTAFLHTESLGVTSRHHMIRHLANQLRKLKKEADVATSLSALSLSDSHLPNDYLHSLEEIFSFSNLQPDQFPHMHTTHFRQQIKNLPAGVTVCVLSSVGVCPGSIDTILLSRLERDATPITMRIPTSHLQVQCIEKLKSVLGQQKERFGISEKSEWWEARRSLDKHMQVRMEMCLGVWRCLLLPLTSDPELSVQMKKLGPILSESCLTPDMLKVVLSSAPHLSKSDLTSLVNGAITLKDECLELLQDAVTKLHNRMKPQGHTVLVLDKYLQKLPWENISCLKSCSVTRMPSLHSVLGHTHLQQVDRGCVLARGIDSKQVFYLLNPDNNLPDTEERFRDWFCGEKPWQGVCGSTPDTDQLKEAVMTKDLYIYIGHGAGVRYLDTARLLKGGVRAAALLFGCSSVALSTEGTGEGSGIVLTYLTAGCPLVLGNLWDVTDRDIDRFTAALLRSWLSAGRGSSLLEHLPSSRNATRLPHIIGAAPVAYGLPVCLR